jgi:2-oxoglutarate dehydrogenase E1 component
VQPTTPAQVFHLLRRQVRRPWRKPLIVLTPKSLLRLPEASSRLDELTSGRFERVVPDRELSDPARVERILLCSGRIYYDLRAERKRRGDDATAIIRIEQLYPWRPEELERAMAALSRARQLVWVQDEPANMGARQWLWPRLSQLAGQRSLRAVSREESASPATGSSKAHAIEQKRLLDAAFARA